MIYNKQMDRNSKILWIFSLILLIISIYLAYYRFYVSKNYSIIESEIEFSEDAYEVLE